MNLLAVVGGALAAAAIALAPAAWAGPLAGAGVSLAAGAGDRVLRVVPAIAVVVALLVTHLGVGPLGPAVTTGVALLIWGASSAALLRLGAVGGVVIVVLLGLDPLAAMLDGAPGAVLDGVSPGRALRRAGAGALDARAWLALAAPGLIAHSLGTWRASRSENERVRIALVPAVLALALVTVAPLPLQIDLSGRSAFSLSDAQTHFLSSLQVPLLLTFETGPALGREQREAVRAARDLVPALRGASASLVTEQHLTTEGEGFVLRVRALEAVETLELAGPSVTDDLISALVRIRDGGPARVRWLGTPPDGIGASLSNVTLVEEGASTWVLSPGTTPDPTTHEAVDQHVLNGGGLVALLGPGEGVDAPGARVVGPWGIGVQEPTASPSTGQVSPHAAMAGLEAIGVPAGTSTLAETPGLTEPLVSTASGPVALALAGSVPSGVAGEGDAALRTMSDGAVRVVAMSRVLAEAHPELVARGLAWVLGREDRIALGSPPPAAPATGRRALGLGLALLCVGAMGFGRRSAS